jgi:hypothetical protein
MHSPDPAPFPLASVSESSIFRGLSLHNGQLGNLGLDIWLVSPWSDDQ